MFCEAGTISVPEQTYGIRFHSDMAHVILYDGLCKLCNRMNRFVLRRDKDDRFRFLSLQSEQAAEILARYGRKPEILETVIVIADYQLPSERLLERGEAVRFIARNCSGVWRLAGFVWILPGSFLNPFYNLIARNRYRWFGKYDSCSMPGEKERGRFL